MKAFRIWMGFLLGLLPLSAQEGKTVSADLRQESAWMGEGISLVIKLWSPGPFSGTAAFDLPTLSRTAFLKVGSPVVGSEAADGKTYFTQTHQFSIYTQQIGKVIIPSFTVRYAGSKDFTSAAEDLEGKTDELSFISNRPPGSEGMGVVVTTREMKISQSWSPAEGREVDAGDVLRRTITRSAGGTTAMMFPPVDDGVPEGVKVYDEDPIVEDKTARGDVQAKRVETLRYQFVKAGTFTLPDLTFVWWDPEAKELKEVTLPGETVTVKMSAAMAATETEGGRGWMYLAIAGALVVLVGISRKRIVAWYREWHLRRHCPEIVSARELEKACKASDATAAYLSAMAWQRSVGLISKGTGNEVFDREIAQLSVRLFGTASSSPSWSGEALGKAFAEVCRSSSNRTKLRYQRAGLPPLNAPLIKS